MVLRLLYVEVLGASGTVFLSIFRHPCVRWGQALRQELQAWAFGEDPVVKEAADELARWEAKTRIVRSRGPADPGGARGKEGGMGLWRWWLCQVARLPIAGR